MRKRGFSKAAILSIALTVGPAILVAVPSTSIVYAQEMSSDTTVMLELFDQQPGDSSAPLSVADLTGGGDLGDLMTMDNAAQGRYLRVTVTQGDNTDVRLYRVLITPSNGRTFIVSPQGVISLDNLLRQSGLMVAKDNMAVTMGTGAVELKIDGLTSTDSSTSNTPAATDTSTPASTDTSTSTATDTSTSSTTTGTDTSTAAATTAAPADTSTAAAPADTSMAAAPADTSTAAAPADTSAATPAATAPADTSAASSADTTAQPLTATINQDLGKLSLSVLPTSASAPASSETNFYVLPYTDATDPTQGIKDNLVTLDYASAASLTDVAAYYDKLMADQGFTKATDDAQNKSSDAQIVQVYKRGNATVTLTIDRDPQGKYKVSVDLSNLVQSLGQ